MQIPFLRRHAPLPTAPGSPVPPKVLYEFHQKGFTVLRGVLSADEAARLNRLIDAAQGGPLSHKFEFLRIDPVFMDLMEHPKVLPLLRYWLGDDLRMDHAMGVQYGGPFGTQGEKENLHGGPGAGYGSFQYWWGEGRSRATIIKASYCLMAQRQGDGGLVMVPGSHRRDGMCLTGDHLFHEVLNGKMDPDIVVQPALEPGDVLLFTDTVAHGTARWKPTDRGRRMLYYSYMPGYAAHRDMEHTRRLVPLARSEAQRGLLRPPWVHTIPQDGPGIRQGEETHRGPIS